MILVAMWVEPTGRLVEILVHNVMSLVEISIKMWITGSRTNGLVVFQLSGIL